MSEEKALVPVEQKTVVFYDDEIPVVLIQEDRRRQIFVPVRPICDYLGVDWSGQRQRIMRDPVLSGELVSCVVVTPTQGQPDQRREVQCLPLEFINGFLFGINASRVKEQVRDRLIRYQRECYKVLSEAFQEGRLTSEPAFSDLLDGDSPAAQAYKIAAAMMRMARQQLILENRLDHHTTRLDDYERRLEDVESTLGDPQRHITPDQASRISQAVKAIAMQLSKRSDRNEYGGVYGELYRRFSITSYKELPANRYDEAIEWLNEWLQSLISDSPF